jgi:hypothetical protein
MFAIFPHAPLLCCELQEGRNLGFFTTVNLAPTTININERLGKMEEGGKEGRKEGRKEDKD